jgi:hypothetical protein
MGVELELSALLASGVIDRSTFARFEIETPDRHALPFASRELRGRRSRQWSVRPSPSLFSPHQVFTMSVTSQAT